LRRRLARSRSGRHSTDKLAPAPTNPASCQTQWRAIDGYFADEPMSDVDKILFALASYNAGPGRQVPAEDPKEAVWTF
jgi:hypothetical protein